MGTQLKTSNKGFSLMEVLIAIIIVAIGLLGFLTLQLTSINSNQEGMARSQANLILQDLGAKLRSNREYIFTTQGDNLYLSANNNVYNSCNNAAPVTCVGATANCSQAQQAQYDVWGICRTMKSYTPNNIQDDPMPNARLYVDCNSRDGAAGGCSSGSTLTAYLFWAMSERRQDVGQLTSTNSNGLLSERCNSYVASSGINLDDVGAEVDCITLDLMP